MKTQSMLKMLLVTALFVSPVVMAKDEPKTNDKVETTVKAEGSIYKSVTEGLSTAVGTVVAVPGNVYQWVTASKANAFAAAVITAFVAKEAYVRLTAPARAN